LRTQVLSARPRYLQDLAGPEFTQLLTWCQQNNWYYQTLRPVCSTEESRVGREQVLSVTFEVNTPGNNPGRRSERNPPLQAFYSTQWHAHTRRETGVSRGTLPSRRSHDNLIVSIATSKYYDFHSFPRNADDGAPRVIVLRQRPNEEPSWQYLKKGHRFLYYALRYPLLFYSSAHFICFCYTRHCQVLRASKYCRSYFMFRATVRTAFVRIFREQLKLVWFA
jgi:hypothetical protein